MFYCHLKQKQLYIYNNVGCEHLPLRFTCTITKKTNIILWRGTKVNHHVTNYNLFVTFYYHAMHFSAKRGLAITCRLSVCDVGGLWLHRLEILHWQLAQHLRSLQPKGDPPSPRETSINQSINLFPKYDNRASIINSGGRTKRQLTALTVALENHK